MRTSIRAPRAAKAFLASFLLFGLVACEEGVLNSAPLSSAPVEGGTSVERDVERAEVFSVSENALWDGRPSLGGVWVAYPGDFDPERVVLTNVATGDTVIGALFRRERENPGPAIQLSSDAASALGVLAGNPTEISIVALRRETVEIAPPPAPEPDIEATEPHDDSAAQDLGAIVEEVLSDVPVAAPLANAVEAPLAREATPAPAVAAPAGPPPSKPYIQIGTFSSEQNAKDLVTILGNAGVLAEVRTNTSGERTLYRVVSGPASTRAERNERLEIIKSLGFTDAFIF